MVLLLALASGAILIAAFVASAIVSRMSHSQDGGLIIVGPHKD